ncbi:MAG: hypothetical protein ACYYKD_10575 [Rhodospirillales bacterium]
MTKAVISAVVLLLYGGFGLLNLDNGSVGWVALALAAVTVVAVCIYPHIDVRPSDIKSTPPDFKT